MLNILKISNKLYLAECFVQTSGNSMNRGIGTSVQKNWRGREWNMMFFYQGGTFE